MEGERAHLGATDRAGVVQHALEIESLAAGFPDLLAGDGVEQIRTPTRARDPLIHRVILQHIHHEAPPSRVSFQFFNTLDCVGRSTGTSRSGSTALQLARMAAGNC